MSAHTSNSVPTPSETFRQLDLFSVTTLQHGLAFDYRGEASKREKACEEQRKTKERSASSVFLGFLRGSI